MTSTLKVLFSFLVDVNMYFLGVGQVYGNNVEIQALCEMYNRPIHIYSYSTGIAPLNVNNDIDILSFYFSVLHRFIYLSFFYVK